MYYEQVANKLNALFEGIERTSQDPSSKPLGELKDYFAYLISQPIFSSFIENQKKVTLSGDIDPRDLPAFPFLWLAFYSACTKRDKVGAILETDPVGCRELERCGLFPLTWINGVLIAMFHTYKPYEWGQDLRKDGMFSRLERLHHSALAHLNTALSGLEVLHDEDRREMQHLAIRDKGYYLLLHEVFSAHFKEKIRLSKAEYLFLNTMLAEPKSFSREVLAQKISKAADLNHAKNVISGLKKKINGYCNQAGLTDLVVGRSPYHVATLSPRGRNSSNQ